MGGWVVGLLDLLKIRLISASIEVEVEVEAQLGKNLYFIHLFIPQQLHNGPNPNIIWPHRQK